MVLLGLLAGCTPEVSGWFATGRVLETDNEAEAGVQDQLLDTPSDAAIELGVTYAPGTEQIGDERTSVTFESASVRVGELHATVHGAQLTWSERDPGLYWLQLVACSPGQVATHGRGASDWDGCLVLGIQDVDHQGIPAAPDLHLGTLFLSAAWDHQGSEATPDLTYRVTFDLEEVHPL